MKKKQTTPAVVNSSNSLQVEAKPGTSRERMLTDVAAKGIAGNAKTVMDFSKATFGELSLTDMVGSLSQQAQRVNQGDMAGMEQILTAQVSSLNAMFAELTRRAALNMGEYIDAAERYLRLAMKAQGQCRATVETLAVIKNPPVFAKQANIAHGPQQVNNGVGFDSSPHAHAGEKGSQQTKLLVDGPNGGTYLDLGTTPATARGDTTLETVGTRNRA